MLSIISIWVHDRHLEKFCYPLRSVNGTGCSWFSSASVAVWWCPGEFSPTLLGGWYAWPFEPHTAVVGVSCPGTLSGASGPAVAAIQQQRRAIEGQQRAVWAGLLREGLWARGWGGPAQTAPPYTNHSPATCGQGRWSWVLHISSPWRGCKLGPGSMQRAQSVAKGVGAGSKATMQRCIQGQDWRQTHWQSWSCNWNAQPQGQLLHSQHSGSNFNCSSCRTLLLL